MSKTLKAWINLILLGLTLVINTLGAIGLINGMTQKDVSDKYMTLITPSPFTFSIWSIIYPLLFISLIVLIVKNKDEYYGRIIEGISPLFWASCIFNALWIVSFSFEIIWLSSILIFALLICLALILQKLRAIGGDKKYLLPFTFGLYTGWLFIANVVNIAATLVSFSWNGFGLGEETWSIIVLIIAVILVALVVLRNRNAIFPLPIAWAYFGINMFLSSSDGFNGEYRSLEIIAVIGGVVLLLLAILILYMNKFKLIGEEPKEGFKE